MGADFDQVPGGEQYRAPEMAEGIAGFTTRSVLTGRALRIHLSPAGVAQ
jgi:hypothetical protein